MSVMKTRGGVVLLGMLLLLSPGLMGMSETYFIYALQAEQMACGRYTYFSEPVFLLLMSVSAEAVGLLQGVDCETTGGGGMVLAPLVLSFVGCLALVYAIRPMGVYALMFFAYIVLDGATRMLPFHLLRQFLSFVVFACAFYFVLSDRWDKTALVWASLLAALIHFSGWLLVLMTVFALFVSSLFETKGNWNVWQTLKSGNLWKILGGVSALPLLLAFSPIPDYILTKLSGRISYPFSALVQVIGSGSGLVFFAKHLIILGGLHVLSVREKSLFLSLFSLACAGVWFAVLALGFDSTVFNRVQLTIIPLAYLAFLIALSRNKLSAQAEFWNVILLTAVVGSYFYDAKTAQFIEPSGVLSLSFFQHE